MRGKLTLLVTCAAFLMLSAGTAWGQLRSGWAWGTGNCEDNGTIVGAGTYTANVTGSVEAGLKVGGTRSRYWNSWTNTGVAPSNGMETTNSAWYVVSTQSCDCTDDNTNNPTSDWPAVENQHFRYLQWFDGFGWRYRDDYYERNVTCCNNTGSGSGTLKTPAGEWTTIAGNQNAGMTTLTSVFYGHDVDHPHTNHMNHVRINVSGGSVCVPNHYERFHWGDAIWFHQRNNYTFNWGTLGASASNPTITGSETTSTNNYTTTGLYNSGFGSSTGSTTTAYAETGTIRINANGTDVRLHEPMTANWTRTVGYLDFNNTTGNTFRFDAAFVGTPTSSLVTVQNSTPANPWSIIGTGRSLSGIGFWTSTNQTHQILNLGTLWLGPTTTGQNNITLTAAGTDVVTVANYLCCDDSEDNAAITHGHGVLFNVGTIANTTTGTGLIEIKNDQNCASVCASAKTWLYMDANTALPNLYLGNANIWAHGDVRFLNNVSVSYAAKGTHEIHSINGALIFDDNYAINNLVTTANTYENYHVDGMCCGSYIYAAGTQTYVFAGDDDFLRMKTAFGKIEMAQSFSFGGAGENNILDISGQSYVLINGVTTVLNKGESHASIVSPAGFVRLEDELVYRQSAPGGVNKGLVINAMGICDALNCGFPINGGYVWIEGKATTLNVGNGVLKIISDNSSVTMADGFQHTGVSGGMQIVGQSGVELLSAKNVLITRSDNGNDSIMSPKGQVHVEGTFTYNQTSTANPNGHLLVNASSQYAFDCVWGCTTGPNAGLGGYLWIEDIVKTTNRTNGTSTFRSNGEFIRVDKPWIHTAADSSLLIWAQGNCAVTCSVLNSGDASNMSSSLNDCVHTTPTIVWEEGYLVSKGTPGAKDGRPTAQSGGYIWFKDEMTAFNFTGASKDGDIIIKSDNDIVQFDKSLTNASEANGSHFLVWGGKGVRTIGPAVLKNNAIDRTNPSEAYNRFLSTITPIATRDSMPRTKGNVTFYSPDGFIDFWNTFNYEVTSVTADSSSLNINAAHRVEFANSATVKMAARTRGDVNIKAEDGFVNFQNIFDFSGAQGDVNIFAKGKGINSRSTLDSAHYCDNNGGFVRFTDAATFVYNNSSVDSSKVWIRSDYDDVEISDNFIYTNINGTKNGEIMIQAGQDIYGSNVDGVSEITFNQKGEKAILWEAKKTIHTKQPVLFDRSGVSGVGASTGNIILKAGYNSFADSANISTSNAGAGGWTAKGDCNLYSYTNRGPCVANNFTGADIWFEGNFTTLLGAADNTIQTILRAYHSIYIDSNFEYTQTGTGDGGKKLLFAETGNVEAIVGNTLSGANSSVEFNIPATDITELRIQAGNQVWNEGDTCDRVTNWTTCWITGRAPGAEFDGNILLNKPLSVNHEGLGFTMLSSARDIENQVLAPVYFDYDNNTITDSLIMTAGRHIETHAKVTFDYSGAGDGIGDPGYLQNGAFQILMQAGRLDTAGMTCSPWLCKAVEEGTSLWNGTAPWQINGADNGTTDLYNNFAAGGRGQGSILLFDSVNFIYDGQGAIIMRALNGNIESDPYLHRADNRVTNSGTDNEGYNAAANVHDAPIIFNHGGSGVTRLEAIDINLHDKLDYTATQSAANNMNGQFYMAAFDSILTRNIRYTNPMDIGSVFITTDKYKFGANCVEYLCNTDFPGGIHQGHIVLGYGADCNSNNDVLNHNDSIVFDYNSHQTNRNTTGSNVHILAGFAGFTSNPVTGVSRNSTLFANDITGMDLNKGKGYGGNITFDYTEFYMPLGNGMTAGSTEIRTPNGNIWGKDSILYRGINGGLLVDAGQGSVDDKRAIRWNDPYNTGVCVSGHENILNTSVPFNCGDTSLWRTGNIMMKGGTLNFGDPVVLDAGTGNAVFRTREGYIDTYDAFTVDSMGGHLLKYAGMDNLDAGRNNNWGDVSERDFRYTPVGKSGSVFFGADDNIMMNYGNSNLRYDSYGNGGPGYGGNYNIGLSPRSGSIPNSTPSLNAMSGANPYYYTAYEKYIDGLCVATFNVNVDGYLWYNNVDWERKLHRMYRGCVGNDCSGFTGQCITTSNGARDLDFNFDTDINNNPITSGGVAFVASNFIDMFTKFTYNGGDHQGIGAIPTMGNLHGENVRGFGLYIKSQFNGIGNNYPEKRRATCEGCHELKSFPMGGGSSIAIPEMTYIGFHDDARIHTHNQKSWIEAPVIEFFGHAELDSRTKKGSKTRITLKGDSLIFHDSVIFDDRSIELLPFTTDPTQRANDMRYGVINDKGRTVANYSFYGPAIEMEDRGLPVIELGYQRCNEPRQSPHSVPNSRSLRNGERTPTVGGDIVVAFKHDFSLPIFNTIVANHARISFVTDSLDNISGGEYVDAFFRTDLLRIRNKVEFYTDPANYLTRSGKFVMSTPAQMDDALIDPGMYTRHLHTEPGSELSIPGEDSLVVFPTTVVGGFGTIHENVMVVANGIIAPGFA